MNRRHFLQTSAGLVTATLSGQSLQALQAAGASSDSLPMDPSQPPITSGAGEFRYQYVPEKLVLPPEVKLKNAHGLCLDPQGNIYFTFEPASVDESTRCLARFAPDGTKAELLGTDNALAHGTPHGLNIHIDKDGQPVLYHANNQATIHKTTLDGRILWTQKWPAQMGNFKPTDTVAPPGSEYLFVADGYGSSMIHVFRTSDGVYAGKSWGGQGQAHGELHCPHAITYDPRRKQLLVIDRTNKRLEYYSEKGFYQSTVQAPELAAPCNVDWRGDYALVPDLNGPVGILDKDNRLVSILEVGKLMGDRGFKHPHDAIWLANGDIAVCTWNPGRLGYWRKVG